MRGRLKRTHAPKGLIDGSFFFCILALSRVFCFCFCFCALRGRGEGSGGNGGSGGSDDGASGGGDARERATTRCAFARGVATNSAFAVCFAAATFTATFSCMFTATFDIFASTFTANCVSTSRFPVAFNSGSGGRGRRKREASTGRCCWGQQSR